MVVENVSAINKCPLCRGLFDLFVENVSAIRKCPL